MTDDESDYPVFDLSIFDLITLRNFICISTAIHEIY